MTVINRYFKIIMATTTTHIHNNNYLRDAVQQNFL